MKEREGKKVLMASLDVNRPAAMEQLQILGAQIGVDTLPIVKGEDPVAIAKRAKTQASLHQYVHEGHTQNRHTISKYKSIQGHQSKYHNRIPMRPTKVG